MQQKLNTILDVEPGDTERNEQMEENWAKRLASAGVKITNGWKKNNSRENGFLKGPNQNITSAVVWKQPSKILLDNCIWIQFSINEFVL